MLVCGINQYCQSIIPNNTNSGFSPWHYFARVSAEVRQSEDSMPNKPWKELLLAFFNEEFPAKIRVSRALPQPQTPCSFGHNLHYAAVALSVYHKFPIVWKRKNNRFYFIQFQINFIVKKLFEIQDWKMGKGWEEWLVVTVQKYICLYDEAITAFNNKNMGKNK